MSGSRFRISVTLPRDGGPSAPVGHFLGPVSTHPPSGDHSSPSRGLKPDIGATAHFPGRNLGIRAVPRDNGAGRFRLKCRRGRSGRRRGLGHCASTTPSPGPFASLAIRWAIFCPEPSRSGSRRAVKTRRYGPGDTGIHRLTGKVRLHGHAARYGHPGKPQETARH